MNHRHELLELMKRNELLKKQLNQATDGLIFYADKQEETLDRIAYKDHQ